MCKTHLDKKIGHLVGHLINQMLHSMQNLRFSTVQDGVAEVYIKSLGVLLQRIVSCNLWRW